MPTDPATMPWGSIETITRDENLLILVARPGDESLSCGGLIAQSCRRGRPPFVMVLGDGSASHPGPNALPPERLASLHERETREAVGRLGLKGERLLMAGLYDGSIPDRGETLFEAVVGAIIHVMWRTDCNMICSPWPHTGDVADGATHAIAGTVAARSGVGHLSFASSGATALRASGWQLDVTAQLGAKCDAIAAHRTLRGIGRDVAATEIFITP